MDCAKKVDWTVGSPMSVDFALVTLDHLKLFFNNMRLAHSDIVSQDIKQLYLSGGIDISDVQLQFYMDFCVGLSMLVKGFCFVESISCSDDRLKTIESRLDEVVNLLEILRSKLDSKYAVTYCNVPCVPCTTGNVGVPALYMNTTGFQNIS